MEKNKNNLLSKIMKVSIKLNKLNLKKSGNNSFLKFQYYELDDFLTQLYELCDEYRIFFKIDIQKDKTLLTIKDYDTEEFETFTHEYHYDLNEHAKNNDKMDILQREGCISTYMRRYILLNAFGISEPDSFDTTEYMKSLQQTFKNSTITEGTPAFDETQKYTQIAQTASQLIDKLEQNPTITKCMEVYNYFSSKGINKTFRGNTLTDLQYKRLGRIYSTLKQGA